MEKQKKKPNLKFLKLKAMRRKYELEQADFAILLDIKTQTYSSKENGRSSFSHKEIIKILWAFNRKAERAGHDPVAFEDVFLRPDDNIPVKLNEPIIIRETLEDSLLIYRVWFCNLPSEKQMNEMARLFRVCYPQKED